MMADQLTPDSREGWSLVKQGAEARVYSTDFLGKPAIVKERFVKSYRVAALDEKLTHRRMGQEVRSMARCRRHGIRAPAVYHLDLERRVIHMEHITDGVLMKDYVSGLNPERDSAALNHLMGITGSVIAKMHDVDVIHGDLTTSNMVYDCDADRLTLIDFGLSFASGLAEDKGVDLYVLERAFLSTHPGTEDYFRVLLHSYTETSKQAASVVRKLDEVRLRGRKRTMVG